MNVGIALSAARESRHMKSIAIVTMVFLPGTFFAVRTLPIPLSPSGFQQLSLHAFTTADLKGFFFDAF